MVHDEGDDPFPVTVDHPLREANEFDVVVLQPLQVPFSQRTEIHCRVPLLRAAGWQRVPLQEGRNPTSLVG
jgi:hypothetical protein